MTSAEGPGAGTGRDDGLAGAVRAARTLLQHPVAPVWCVVAAVVLTFGYEVFGFHLSLDETLAGTRTTRAWSDTLVGQGRWASGVVIALLPNAVGPVVTTAAGVALLALASAWLARRVLGLGPWPAAAAVALAVSAPATALVTTFSFLVLPIGIAHVAVVVFAAGIGSSRWADRVLAVVAAAVAIGVYDPFLVALAVVVLALTAALGSWRPLGVGVPCALLGWLLSWLLGRLASVLRDSPLGDYRSRFLDPGGLLAHPVDRLSSAVGQTYAPFAVTNGSVGTAAPWVWLLLVVLVGLALLALTRALTGRSPARAAGIVGLALAPVLAVAATTGAPVRTMVYLPELWVALVAVASTTFAAGRPAVPDDAVPTRARRRHGTVWSAAALVCVLACLSQAVAANRVFLAGRASLAHDEFLAFTIEQRRAELAGPGTVQPVVVSAVGFEWPRTALAHRVETSGQSLLNGDPTRASAFLLAEGVGVRPATAEEETRGRRLLDAMPAYPRAGWIAVRDGILLVKLTDRTEE